MSVDISIDDGAVGASVTEQVESVDSFQSSFRHPDAAGVHLGAAVIVLGPPRPRAEVRRAVGSLDVVDQVLHQGDLLHGVDDLEAAGDHLDEVDQVQGHTVQLGEAQL